MSTQEVYERALNEDLPGFHRPAGGKASHDSPKHSSTPRGVLTHVVQPEEGSFMPSYRNGDASALYEGPEELRIWVNRWRDTEGDLHDESFIYVLIGEGQWLVRD